MDAPSLQPALMLLHQGMMLFWEKSQKMWLFLPKGPVTSPCGGDGAVILARYRDQDAPPSQCSPQHPPPSQSLHQTTFIGSTAIRYFIKTTNHVPLIPGPCPQLRFLNGFSIPFPALGPSPVHHRCFRAGMVKLGSPPCWPQWLEKPFLFIYSSSSAPALRARANTMGLGCS